MTDNEIISMIGGEKFSAWVKYRQFIESQYDMDVIEGNGGKRWNYEFKYRRGGKTLCALYCKEGVFGFMIIFGRDEREKVELIRDTISDRIMSEYDNAETYHDGKWVMFDICDISGMNDIKKFLHIKRKPNRK